MILEREGGGGREERKRCICVRVYVCTEDGGAGRKRDGDSVCEKRKKTQI